MTEEMPARPERGVPGFHWVYSNCDHVLEADVVKALEANPGTMYAGHAAWNFHGSVWKHTDGKWYEEIRQYGSLMETITADTIEELIAQANDKYGSN